MMSASACARLQSASHGPAASWRHAPRWHQCQLQAVQRPRRRAASRAFSLIAAAAASERLPRPENAPGDFYVDHTCIDCDTCRWMAPASFTRAGDMSAVTQQPHTEEERRQAMQALISCPTFSIHCRQPQAGELRAAQQSFPLAVPGCANVYWCGFSAESSFGATAYFIRRPQGNIMVDVPRWTPLLAQRLRQLGGVRWILLTHRDDVGDHAAWAEHTGATRIIHRSEASKRQGTDKCEVLLEGEGPWQLSDSSSSSSSSSIGDGITLGSSSSGSSGGDGCSSSSSSAIPGGHPPGSTKTLDSDVQLVFTPGHTEGCVSLLYRPDGVLFTGDHLAWSQRLQRLTIFRAHNWHSVAKQLDSVAALRTLDFRHVLPGHGRRASFADAAEKQRRLDELLAAEGWQGK